MKRDDALWKAILEDVFDDFLRFFVPNAEKIFDIERGFVFLDKELEQLFPSNQDEFNPKYVDKLVKVFTNEGNEQWILVHIEVQGATDKGFSKRMFTYFYRIFDKYQRPITAFAILTDRNKQFHPTRFEQNYLGTKLLYDYTTFKIIEQDENELMLSENPFAIVILTVKTALLKGKVSDNELFDQKVNLVKRLLSKQFDKDKIRALMNFLKLYVRFEKKVLSTKFDKELDTLTNKQQPTMGIEEFVLTRERKLGELKGIEKKNLDFVQNLLTKTDFDDAKIAELAGVKVTFVQKERLKLQKS
jgi:hypothetical protein